MRAEVRSLVAGAGVRVWLYKGAWEEWEPHEIEMAVPHQPGRAGAEEAGDLPAPDRRRTRPCSPAAPIAASSGSRAEDRNISTARTYDALGLPEYYAMEAFVKWKDS